MILGKSKVIFREIIIMYVLSFKLKSIGYVWLLIIKFGVGKHPHLKTNACENVKKSKKKIM